MDNEWIKCERVFLSLHFCMVFASLVVSSFLITNVFLSLRWSSRVEIVMIWEFARLALDIIGS